MRLGCGGSFRLEARVVAKFPVASSAAEGVAEGEALRDFSTVARELACLLQEGTQTKHQQVVGVRMHY